MKTNLTPEDVTTELKNAVTDLVARRKEAETIREKVNAVQREVLQGVALFNDLEVGRGLDKQRIVDPKQTYLSQDEGALEYYYEVVDMNLRELGVKPADMPLDHCPALVAEHERTKAEWTLIDEAAKMLGVYEEPGQFNNGLLCTGLDKRQQLIDLTVNLVESL